MPSFSGHMRNNRVYISRVYIPEHELDFQIFSSVQSIIFFIHVFFSFLLLFSALVPEIVAATSFFVLRLLYFEWSSSRR